MAALASVWPSPNKPLSVTVDESSLRTIRLPGAFFGSNSKPEENFRIS
jgi:hypothetical protein